MMLIMFVFLFTSRRRLTIGSLITKVQPVAIPTISGLTGSYSRAPKFPSRYARGLQYTKSIDLPWSAAALLTAGVTKSDFNTRFGVTLSFFKRVDTKIGRAHV